MSEKEKLELLEDTFDLDPGTLSSDLTLDGQEWWDSLSKLSIVVMMEEEFGKKITSEDVRSFVTVHDLLKIMNK